jgi:hypothetical protein
MVESLLLDGKWSIHRYRLWLAPVASQQPGFMAGGADSDGYPETADSQNLRLNSGLWIKLEQVSEV